MVGSSIAASVQIPNLDTAFAASVGESYEQLLIVAHAQAGDTLSIQAAEGIKCPRCWNVATPKDTNHAVHNEVCPRCFDVVMDY
ncbi:MAG: zinc finger domain-containing protein [Mariprofundaceae bacterium]|nr:zinc finger domain-containing protein [Mariprofundaceae bacterium]